MSAPMERIKALDLIEKDIMNCLQNAGTYFITLILINK